MVRALLGAPAVALGLTLCGVTWPASAPAVSAAAGPVVELRTAQRLDDRGAAHAVTLPDYRDDAAPPAPGAPAGGVHARYRLVLHVTGVPRRPALFVPALIAHAGLRVNGQQVFEAAADPLLPLPRGVARIRLVDVPPAFLAPGDNVIELDLAGPGFTSLSRVWFGDRDALLPRYRAQLVGRVVGPAVVSLLMGALALGVLGLWMRQRDPLYGYFGLGALAWALHGAWGVLPFSGLQGLHFLVWWTSLFSFFAAMLTIFAVRFAGWHWPRFERTVWATALAGPLILYAARGFGVFDAAREVWPFVWYAAAGVALVAVCQHAWRQRGVASVLLLLCCAVSLGFAIHDWFAVHDASDNAPVYLLPYASLFFITLMAWLLIDRFVAANRTLAALNSELEQRVAAKSAELLGVLEQMREARDAAQAANRAKSSFLAAASHDLRQPIHALGLFMSALQGDDANPRQRALLHNMSESHEALSSMFDALLDISRMDAGAVVPHRGAFALDRLLRRICDDSLPLARAKGLRLRLRLSPAAAGLRAESDPLLVERIVRNLLGNAVKYTPQGGVLLSCRWRAGAIASAGADPRDTASTGTNRSRDARTAMAAGGFAAVAGPQPGCWWIEVRDTGIGIAAAEQRRVFEEFYQVGEPHRDRAGGLGLGLSIVRRLTDLLALPLVMASVPGRGTCFRLELPATTALPPAQASMPAFGAMQGIGVAVIEDDPAVRRAMQALLERWGCSAFVGEDANGVLRALAVATGFAAEVPLRIVIADYQLRGGRNGIDEIQALRAACGAELPAVIISADSAPERLSLIQRGGFDYLSKPVAPARLRSWLQQAARRGASSST